MNIHIISTPSFRSCAQCYAAAVLAAPTLDRKQQIARLAKSQGSVFSSLVGVYLTAGASAQNFAVKWRN